MGSKKKKAETESSSSSSDSSSESSDSSTEKRSKRKTKKQSKNEETDSGSESAKKSTKKDKPKAKSEELVDVDYGRNSKNEKKIPVVQDESKQRKRRRTPSPENKEVRDRDRDKDKRARDDRRVQEDHDRYDNRRNRQHDYNSRPHDDRYNNRNRRPDFRDRRDDRNRDYRNRRDDNRNYSNRDRDRNRGNNRENYQRRRSRSASFDHTNARWGRDGDNKKTDKKDPKEKQKPNFGLSGKLTEETNTYRGVVIKYSEPPEARKPKRRWRLYPFKGEKALQTLYIHRESAYLIGRDRKVVDLPVDHPSCSKQHAALQYRLVPFTRDDGSAGKRVRPYLIDLNSANGTHINNKRIDASKYVELLEKDVIKFGYSSREYVLLHENSKDEAQDDDVKQEEEEKTVKKEDE